MLLNPQFPPKDATKTPRRRDKSEMLEIQRKFSPPSIPNSCIPPKSASPQKVHPRASPAGLALLQQEHPDLHPAAFGAAHSPRWRFRFHLGLIQTSGLRREQG